VRGPFRRCVAPAARQDKAPVQRAEERCSPRATFCSSRHQAPARVPSTRQRFNAAVCGDEQKVEDRQVKAQQESEEEKVPRSFTERFPKLSATRG